MQRGRILALVALAGAGALAVLEACGSSTDATPDPVDSGTEAAVEAAAETPDSATCDLGANLLDRIPDASIADGASTTGVCLGCANANCGSTIQECNESCACQTAIASGLDCYVKNSANPMSCASVLIVGGVDPSVQGLGLLLINCIQGACTTECATGDFEPDGGLKPRDGGDP